MKKMTVEDVINKILPGFEPLVSGTKKYDWEELEYRLDELLATEKNYRELCQKLRVVQEIFGTAK